VCEWGPPCVGSGAQFKLPPPHPLAVDARFQDCAVPHVAVFEFQYLLSSRLTETST